MTTTYTEKVDALLKLRSLLGDQTIASYAAQLADQIVASERAASATLTKRAAPADNPSTGRTTKAKTKRPRGSTLPSHAVEGDPNSYLTASQIIDLITDNNPEPVIRARFGAKLHRAYKAKYNAHPPRVTPGHVQYRDNITSDQQSYCYPPTWLDQAEEIYLNWQ